MPFPSLSLNPEHVNGYEKPNGEEKDYQERTIKKT